MDDEGDIIYSTPLPGASTMHAPMPILAPVPLSVIPNYAPPSSAPLPQHQHQEHQLPPPPPPPAEKPADYVYYERRPDDLSSDARARATAAKVKLQSHYRFALETAIDLNIRYVAVFQREEIRVSDVLVFVIV
jgi:protein-serine/threonine kinase